MNTYQRPIVDELARRLEKERRFIQTVLGPRQVGKTTAVEQVRSRWAGPSFYAAADLPSIPSENWMEHQWSQARRLMTGTKRPGLLVLDEVQKVPRWSESVKRFWDEDSREKRDLRVVILGSSALLLGKGLTESLAGRFETHRVSHWGYGEMKSAFGWGLDRFLYHGGYPGAAALIREPGRWMSYVRDSLIETVISRDLLMSYRIDKPALLRRLFFLACEYGGQVVSYTKLLGQLTDAGNSTTLAGYQNLLERAWLIAGLPKWSGSRIRQRGSSPKWLPLNTALMTALSGDPFEAWKGNADRWGRLVETAAGAHLFAQSMDLGAELFWWREGNFEVDFVVRHGRKLLAVEVKSGKKKERQPGLDLFLRQWPSARTLLVGTGGVELSEFLSSPLSGHLT